MVRRSMDPMPLEVRHDMDPADPLDRAILEMMALVCVPVAEGVSADWSDNGVWVEVRGVLRSSPRVPGAVGAWLDTLPRDRRVIVWAVTSKRLAYMLYRRGFVPTTRYDQQMGWMDQGAMVREPVPATEGKS